MGGVDLADMLLELYRTDLTPTRWHTRIIYWSINVAVVNGWLYRRHQKPRNQKCEYSLAKFQAHISAEKGKNKRRRSNERQGISPKRRKFVIHPVNNVRYDGYQDSPKADAKICPKGSSLQNAK